MPKNLQQLELFMQSGVGRPQPWWTVMLRDPHWWVPFVVLVGGLVVLRWIR